MTKRIYSFAIGRNRIDFDSIENLEAYLTDTYGFDNEGKPITTFEQLLLCRGIVSGVFTREKGDTQ